MDAVTNTFTVQPKYVGYWEIAPKPYGFCICVTKKPNWFHRKMTKLFLGWTWYDGSLV